MSDKIKVRFKCEAKACRTAGGQREWEGEIYKYQLGLVAIWFHSFHEGHLFSYWENDEPILGPCTMLED